MYLNFYDYRKILDFYQKFFWKILYKDFVNMNYNSNSSRLNIFSKNQLKNARKGNLSYTKNQINKIFKYLIKLYS